MPFDAKALRAIRERKGLTQVQLAKRAKTLQVHVSRLEGGVREPGIDMLERLAKALGVKVTDLLK